MASISCFEIRASTRGSIIGLCDSCQVKKNGPDPIIVKDSLLRYWKGSEFNFRFTVESNLNRDFNQPLHCQIISFFENHCQIISKKKKKDFNQPRANQI